MNKIKLDQAFRVVSTIRVLAAVAIVSMLTPQLRRLAKRRAQGKAVESEPER